MQKRHEQFSGCRAPRLALLASMLLLSKCDVACADAVKQAQRPNFVIILADDLGYGDLACYGNPRIKTPNLDQFAREGVRLTNCYAAAANCSPARTGLMTGRTPYRVGIHNWIPAFSPMHVRKEEITIATLLRHSGYDTCHVGKWHLSGGFYVFGQPLPSDHGFNYWFSTQNNALPSHHNPDNFVRNFQPVGPLEGYSAQLVVKEAVRWLRDIRDTNTPFFLFVCLHEPHEPIATAQRFVDMYPSDDPSLSVHHGNITQEDEAFGQLMSTIDKLGLRNDTFVMFTSDNGPAITNWHPHGSTGPLRGKKGHIYEGGIRVPGILRWPGHIEPATVCDEPVCGVDMLPTLCQLAGVAVPTDRAIDGTSIVPIFENKPVPRKTPLYWQFNYAQSKPKVAMRIGDWKILATLDQPELKSTIDITDQQQQRIKNAELASFELYNLKDDIGETTNLADKKPERVTQMATQLRRLYHEVREESPVWPAWKAPRYEGQRIRAARQAGIWPQWKKAPVEGKQKTRSGERQQTQR